MNKGTKALIAEMKAAAEKATPGQWSAFIDVASSTYSVFVKKVDDVISWMGFDGRKNASNNAKFIALASPKNVLSLIAALEQAQRANAAQDDHINQQGDRINQLERKNEELGGQLSRYSMSPGQADQRMCESRAVRDALGFGKDADNVAPADLRNRIDEMKARIAELEARPLCVKLPAAVDSSNLPFAGNGWNAYREEAIKAIRLAGGTVEGSE